MGLYTVAGLTALALSTVAILVSQRSQAFDWVPSGPGSSADAPANDYLMQLYLHTVKHSVTGILLQTPGFRHFGPRKQMHEEPYNDDARRTGGDWPVSGLARMDNIQDLWGRVLAADVPGDFLEAGVWRGGASIFSRAVLAAHSINDRKVHLVDSFMGLPTPTTKEDSGYWVTLDYLAVSEDTVRASFQRYGLLDDQVAFYKGYFRYSMPELREQYTGPIAILRMDGDMYESTMDVLFNAYDRVPVGGFVIIDDWIVSECQRAIRQFLEMHGGMEEVHIIDTNAMCWQKSRAAPLRHKWYKEFNTSRGSEE